MHEFFVKSLLNCVPLSNDQTAYSKTYNFGYFPIAQSDYDVISHYMMLHASLIHPVKFNFIKSTCVLTNNNDNCAIIEHGFARFLR